ncbi:MAG: hypothetical protein ACOYMA_07700 [Bacteroidia bacterium]
MNDNTQETKKSRYPALVKIIKLYRIFYWIVVVITLLASVNIFKEKGVYQLMGFFSFIVGGFIALLIAAAGESIQVIIDIEENTRNK